MFGTPVAPADSPSTLREVTEQRTFVKAGLVRQGAKEAHGALLTVVPSARVFSAGGDVVRDEFGDEPAHVRKVRGRPQTRDRPCTLGNYQKSNDSSAKSASTTR